ncbi:MAG: hypothetical protein RLY14_3462 [Planctomycetota bacterium]|jgi:hypothetical protein
MRVDPGVLYSDSFAKHALLFLGYRFPTQLVVVVGEAVEPRIATPQPSRFLRKLPALMHILHSIIEDCLDSH